MPPARRPSRAPVPAGERTDVEPNEARRRVIDDLPAIDVAVEPAHADICGRRRRIHDPARYAYAIGKTFHGLLGLIGRRLIADGRLMHVGQMREVEKIVDDELPVALHRKHVALRAPGGIVEPMEIQYRRRIGKRRIAHPDPNPAVALDDRIALDARVGRDVQLCRNRHALARRVVFEPVIAALQPIALDASERQRQAAMAAAVLERGDAPVLGAIEHDRLIEYRAGERRFAEFMSPRRHVPAIAQKHGHLLHFAQRCASRWHLSSRPQTC